MFDFGTFGAGAMQMNTVGQIGLVATALAFKAWGLPSQQVHVGRGWTEGGQGGEQRMEWKNLF